LRGKIVRRCVMLKKKLMKPKLEKMLLESADQALAMAKGEMKARRIISVTEVLSSDQSECS
jgi:hypothetical protein